MLNTIEMAEARAAAMRASWTGDTILTPKGAAVAAGNRFLAAVVALPIQERADFLAAFAPELRGVIADLASAPIA